MHPAESVLSMRRQHHRRARMNEHAKSSHPPPIDETLLTREPWKEFQIMAEFVEGFERLAAIRPRSACSDRRARARSTPHTVGGGDRPGPVGCGFSVISGGGPGIMEAANKGRLRVGLAEGRAQPPLPHEGAGNPYQNISLHFRHSFSRKVMFVKYASAYAVLPGGATPSTSWPRPRPCCRSARPAVSRSFRCTAASGAVSSTGSGPPWCARVPSTRPLELFEVVDNPREVVDAIFKCYEHRGLGLSAEGQEILLHL